jgi:hypothetical protein
MERMWSRGLLALCMLAVAGRSAQKRDCACISPKLTPERLRRVASLNWRQLDRTTIAREWPEAPVLPCGPAGLAGLMAAFDRCCKTGRDLGLVGFEAGFSGSIDPRQGSAGLWGIDVSLCRRSKQEILSALGELVDAVASKHSEATYAYGWSASDGIDQAIYAARWVSGQDAFVLEARAFAVGRKWQAGFKLRRRLPDGVRGTWTLDDGSQVRVLRTEVKDSTHGPGRDLWFSYLTDCLLPDQSCLDQEITRLWPRLEARAEREGVRGVFLTSEDGAGASKTIFPRRRADGEWDAPPWKRH